MRYEPSEFEWAAVKLIVIIIFCFELRQQQVPQSRCRSFWFLRLTLGRVIATIPRLNLFPRHVGPFVKFCFAGHIHDVRRLINRRAPKQKSDR